MSARIAIVGGGGGVGASVAFNLLLRPEPYDVTLVEGRSGMARSHEMDLQQVIAAGASGSVGVVDLDAIADAEVVVITASVPLTVNTSRMVYLQGNAAILREVTAALGGWHGVAIVVTNPVDALTTWLTRAGGLDPRRVLGYTANDSLRVRTAVAGLLGVPPASVEAWVLGEHGEHCVPLLDRIRVGGEPVILSAEHKAHAEDFLRGWYARHVALDSGRSSTWASGHGVARMVAGLTGAGADVWPASVRLNGEYGLSDVALGVPVTLGRGGALRVHEWELSPAELAALGEAAAAVRAAAAQI
jgi:malate/lactate dehydrogenase